MTFENGSLECLLAVYKVSMVHPRMGESNEKNWRYRSYNLEMLYRQQWREHYPNAEDQNQSKDPHGGLKEVFKAAGIPAEFYPYVD